MNFAAISLEKVSTGSASSHLVTYSTAVIIYLAPIHLTGIGNGPIKSISQIPNVKLGFTDIRGISVLGKVRPSRSQLSHLPTNIQQSRYNVIHHNPDCWIFLAIVSS